MAPRLFAGDEELGKRDDEYKPGVKSPLGLGIVWNQRRVVTHGPLRKRIKRLVIGLLGLFAIYLFIHNIPTDLKPARGRPSYTHDAEQVIPPRRPNQAKKPPGGVQSGTSSNSGKKTEEDPHTFNGPIKFYDLASTLHGVAGTGGQAPINRNVLFAASSLKSAAILLPIACEMGKRERSYVHFVLMGRDEIELTVLKSVNGIGIGCNILYHDARPDFGPQSSDFRMEVSTSAAFNHINSFVHPQATIIDGSGVEDAFMIPGLKQRAQILGRTVIELPKDADQNMMWLTLLDSSSLSAWNKANLDIVIHAQPAASGSLIRLLSSLKKADFFTSAPPRLTVELPHEIDAPTKRYLQDFRWPPNSDPSTSSSLTLHHRIPQYGLTPEANSIRFLEAFWPADPSGAHVLVLAPHAEVSPLFFHYLKYAVLEYKYSTSKTGAISQRNLMGISLDLPTTYLNDSTEFSPPISITSEPTPFLWQGPNSNAALYFGDKWVELHDFVARLMASQHKLPTPTTLNEKVVSKTYPSWLEHVLKLARARGYFMLYPGIGREDSLATLHNELYHAPEEYAEDVLEGGSPESGDLTADPEHHKSIKMHKEAALITKPLGTILPSAGDLPVVTDMPILSWDGEIMDAQEIIIAAATYSSIFRREIGGCGVDDEEQVRKDMDTSDLFCKESETNRDTKKEKIDEPVAAKAVAEIEPTTTKSMAEKTEAAKVEATSDAKTNDAIVDGKEGDTKAAGW